MGCGWYTDTIAKKKSVRNLLVLYVRFVELSHVAFLHLPHSLFAVTSSEAGLHTRVVFQDHVRDRKPLDVLALGRLGFPFPATDYI